MMACVYIMGRTDSHKEIKRFPYSAAAVTWLLTNSFSQDGDMWIDSKNSLVATIQTNIQENEND